MRAGLEVGEFPSLTSSKQAVDGVGGETLQEQLGGETALNLAADGMEPIWMHRMDSADVSLKHYSLRDV